MKLDPNAVRERARSVIGCKELTNPHENGENVVSFMVGLDQAHKPHALARVNVYYVTGTVGTQRVVSGKVRQSFRRNVDSLDVVERLLRYPERPLTVDQSLIGFDDTEIEEEEKKASAADARTRRPLQKELELADVGMCILEGERAKLTRHLSDLKQTQYRNQWQKQRRQQQLQQQQQQQQQQGSTQYAAVLHERQHSSSRQQQQHLKQPQNNIQRPQQQQEQYEQQIVQRNSTKSERYPDDENDVPLEYSENEGDDDSSRSSLTGMEFQFSLPADVMAQVDQCLRDITQMDKLVKGVATNGRGTVFLYGNGGVAYTPSIPRALYLKLRQLRNSSFAARPSYVSLGTRDRYFVAFNDGSADWKGPKALDKMLKRCLANGKSPLSVSFGSTYDTFFVVFHDGSWEYQGRGIPKSLEEKLAERDDRADLVTVNLGPSGEWFVKAKNGRMWWSGITDELDNVISQILREQHYLHFMDFGEGGSYFVSYDD